MWEVSHCSHWLELLTSVSRATRLDFWLWMMCRGSWEECWKIYLLLLGLSYVSPLVILKQFSKFAKRFSKAFSILSFYLPLKKIYFILSSCGTFCGKVGSSGPQSWPVLCFTVHRLSLVHLKKKMSNNLYLCRPLLLFFFFIFPCNMVLMSLLFI